MTTLLALVLMATVPLFIWWRWTKYSEARAHRRQLMQAPWPDDPRVPVPSQFQTEPPVMIYFHDRPLRMRYADARGVVTDREILMRHAEAWRMTDGTAEVESITGLCLTRKAERTFRLDRMLELKDGMTGTPITDVTAFLRAHASDTPPVRKGRAKRVPKPKQ